jgi:diguanylate cyclase (GGDEF)-like protein
VKLFPSRSPASADSQSLRAIRDDARRERLLDMEERLRPYRFACFAILALALTSVGAEAGWWWIAPLLVSVAGFAVADRFMRASEHPALWVATAWAIVPLLLADAVVVTGGAASPVLMWFALPAVTLATRFATRGVAIGTAFILVLMLIATVGLDPATAGEHRQELTAAVALVLSAVILSGAVGESDRAHRRRATLDPLTGLFNRSALEQRLGELDGQPAGIGKGASHSLLLCDLDHFKQVNDRYGHATGDAVLRDVAYTMRAVLRAGDSIYRVGGEEILVVLPGATKDDAVAIGERLRRSVAEGRPAGVPVTISVGVAVSRPGPLDTEEMVGLADAALYSAKAGGRDRVVVCAN